MKPDQVFVGDIKRCTSFEFHDDMAVKLERNGQIIDLATFGHIEVEEETIKENAVLIRMKSGQYVDVENLNGTLDYLKACYQGSKKYTSRGGLLLETEPHTRGDVYVDEESLQPYYRETMTDSVSFMHLKKQWPKRPSQQ